MKRIARATWAMLGLSMRANPRLTLGAIGLTVLENVADATPALWMKLLVDAAIDRNPGRALLFALVLAGSYLGGVIGRQVNNIVVGNRIRYVAGEALERDILSLAANLPGIEHHERPEYLDRMALLRNDLGGLTNFIILVLNGIGTVTSVVSTIVLLTTVDARLLLLPLFAIPSLYTGGIVQRINNRLNQRLAEPRRAHNAVIDLATGIAASKEIRVFGLRQQLLARHRASIKSIVRSEITNQAKTSAVHGVGSLVFILGHVAAVVWVAVRAINGTATTGDVLMTVTLAGSVSGLAGQSVGLVQHVMGASQAVGRYLWLRDYSARMQRTGDVDPPVRFTDGIRLEGVAFTYPGTDAVILRDVTTHLPAGTTVALVGENGAGKTSLVKLLCGFYQPTAGHILVDGIDLADIDIRRWRARTSAALQDFARFELIVRETIGLGDLEHIDEESAVLDAVGRARADDVVAQLASGLDTQLGLAWDGGVELSGGQWQRLAIARAMMREEPMLLLLDEPTSALDAYAEHALFERYAAAAKKVASSTGGITLFISHRFSTVRMADHIIVLDDGRIVEEGAHEALMANNGLYAELFELQARSYR